MLRSISLASGRNGAAIRPRRNLVFLSPDRRFRVEPFVNRTPSEFRRRVPAHSRSRSTPSNASVCSGRPTEIRMQFSSPRLS